MKVFSHNSVGKKTIVNYESFSFSGGEEHIRFAHEDLANCKKIEIIERLTNSSKIVRLMMAVDALNRLFNDRVPIELIAPYFPYARQDRVCVTGEALSAAVMANIINSLNFAKVTIWDAHSDVTPALLNRVTNIPQLELLKKNQELTTKLRSGELTLIAPDAGASKKTLKIAEQFGSEIIQAQKLRDLRTGAIVKTEIIGNVTGKNLIIADDICDGGRTFIELAKVLKAQGANEISLFVTHGIFSQGLEVFKGLIDHIYTTDSFRAANEFQTTQKVTLNIIEG